MMVRYAQGRCGQHARLSHDAPNVLHIAPFLYFTAPLRNPLAAPAAADTMRYKVDQLLKLTCGLLKISPDAVLRRARLPATVLSGDGKGIAADEYFTLWQAMEATYGGSDMAARLGIAVAHGPFVPSFFAFSCSHDIRIGLKRLALFKPLVGPLKIVTEESADLHTLHLRPVRSDLQMPASLAHSEMVMFLELFRVHTAEHIIPRDVTLPQPEAANTAYFGCDVRASRLPSLSISQADARLPFVSESDEMWTMFEPNLQRQLAERMAGAGIRERLRNALLESIPSGETTSDSLAVRLHMSKRSLQRHLQDEGTSFQEVLDQTRSDLAEHYLKRGNATLEEVAYLLGYGSPASFFRAFQNWFGMTPTSYRKTLQQAVA